MPHIIKDVRLPLALLLCSVSPVRAGSAAQTSVGARPMANVRSAQDLIRTVGVKSLGLPASMGPVLAGLDAEQPENLQLLEPVAAANRRSNGQDWRTLTADAPIDRSARSYRFAAAADNRASEDQLQQVRSDLGRMRLLTTLYEMQREDDALKMAQSGVADRLEAMAVAKAVRTAAALDQRRRWNNRCPRQTVPVAGQARPCGPRASSRPPPF